MKLNIDGVFYLHKKNSILGILNTEWISESEKTFTVAVQALRKVGFPVEVEK